MIQCKIIALLENCAFSIRSNATNRTIGRHVVPLYPQEHVLNMSYKCILRTVSGIDFLLGKS